MYSHRIQAPITVWYLSFTLYICDNKTQLMKQLATAPFCTDDTKSHVAVVWLPSQVWLFETLWTVDHQAPLSMGFLRQETGVGCHFLFQVSWPKDQTCVSCTSRQILYCRGTWKHNSWWELIFLLTLAFRKRPLYWHFLLLKIFLNFYADICITNILGSFCFKVFLAVMELFLQKDKLKPKISVLVDKDNETCLTFPVKVLRSQKGKLYQCTGTTYLLVT